MYMEWMVSGTMSPSNDFEDLGGFVVLVVLGGT